jgi:hypothetical protein
VLRDILSRDHERLDALLTAVVSSDTVDEEKFEEFRRGLLRHIGIEEKVLFPEMRRRNGYTEVEEQLHRDHAALAALLVPRPTRVEVEQIHAILSEHNPLEEDAGGMYERFEALAGSDLDAIETRVREYPAVPTAPYSDTPHLRRSIEHLLKARRK